MAFVDPTRKVQTLWRSRYGRKSIEGDLGSVNRNDTSERMLKRDNTGCAIASRDR